MPEWSLDEARFREEVFQPIDAGWEPRENLFRCYQLPVDSDDADLIERALDGVSRHVNRNAIGGPHVGVANNLREVHKDAVQTLGDRSERARHRQQVLAARQTLREALRAEVGGAPEIPPAAAAAMAARRAHRFVRREVEEALAGLGCRLREPVTLPPAVPPSDWRKIKQGLGFLRFSTLGAYLRERFPAGAGVGRDDLVRRREELDRKARGDALTAETKILVALQRWLSKDELRDVLRAEALQELAAEAAMSADSLEVALQAPGMPRYLADLGLPAPDDLAYTLLCQVRYPQAAPSTWQTAYQRARASRDLRTAYDVLAAQQSLPADLVTARDELKAQIAEVDQMLAQARALERQEVEAAAELYVQAARLCYDREAEAALRRCRPAEPPRALARVDGEQVHVEWEPSAARVGDITYRIIRQVRGTATGDGSVIAAGTSGLTVTDPAAPAGVPVSYAVWTLRNDEPSVRATTTASIVVLRAVQDLELLPGDGVVELRWRLPAGATGARVLRSDDASTRRSAEATTTSRHDGDGFRDTTVRTGVTYQYQVEAEYRLPGDKVQHATGVGGTVRPQEPPRPVRDLALQMSDDSLVLSWTPPPRGEVQLRLLDTAPDVRPEALLALSSAQRLGAPLRALEPSGPGTLRAAVPADGRRHWLLPLTIVENVAAVGNPVEYDSRLPVITDLRAERLGAQVRLTWRWPPRAVEVRVSAKEGGPPTGPDDPGATSWRVTHAKYERVGCHAAVPGGDCWFSVCVTAFTEGVRVFGPTATVRMSAPLQARYEITRVGRLRYRNHRRLSVTSASGQLPAVRVVARVKLPPLEPGDGVEVACFPAPGTGATSLTGEFVLPTKDRPLYLRAFPLNGAAGRIVLVAANPAQLRID
ncbi:MAG: hypothetical protein ACRDSL_13645 [Pseudonocardiaceae bacterium]